METALPQPRLLDFTKLKSTDDVVIAIRNTKHKFAPDASYTGKDWQKQPIFGSKVSINGKVYSKSRFGLPFMRFTRGSTPRITYENQTLFTFNIHYHGLNTVGSIDGTSMETVFGSSTKLGPRVTFQFPEITNNQCLIWFHGHNMFVSMELIYAGLFGLIQIVDNETFWLNERFQYGDNNLLLAMMDMDLCKEGRQTYANLIKHENRSCFNLVNGVSAINWYSDQKEAPFVQQLYTNTQGTLVKIDILNACLNWRVLYLGVCDSHGKKKSFYVIQNDAGLVNPTKLKMTAVNVGSRISILVDLKDCKDQKAYLFCYDYDLTEVISTHVTFPNQPNSRSLTALGPQPKLENATPYPSPIADPDSENQQKDPSNLDYPNVDLIPQKEQVLDNGTFPIPKCAGKKLFLKISCSGNREISLSETLSLIRKTIFGAENYHRYKGLLKQPGFEYGPKANYLAFLNENYFYNLPKFDNDIAKRNICLFWEGNANSIASGNANGTTEYINGVNRIMVDLWNTQELDLDWALKQYMTNPNNYKPPTLPTSKFRIYSTNDEFANTAMISNDTLCVQIFKEEVAYGDLSAKPLTELEVVFPGRDCLNIEQWLSLVNETFSQHLITVEDKTLVLSDFLYCDWSFFPYALNALRQKTTYIKSAVIKTQNKSKYWIRFQARWPLLQFFGKPLTGDTLHKPNANTPSLLTTARTKRKILMSKDHERLIPLKGASQYVKCDEVGIYGIYDAEIQQVFPFYATVDGSVQLPIACMKRSGELILEPNNTYIGLYDGYLNDNLNSFSVNLGQSEQWIYTNGDDVDAHPLHFHLTSGFVSPQSENNSPGLVSARRSNMPLIYSRDIYQVGPQETVAFYLTWPYYASNERTSTPNVRNAGGVIHCHFLLHNDLNSMIIQYSVNDPNNLSISEKPINVERCANKECCCT